MRYKREFLVPYLRDVASVELIKAWCEQEQRAETQLLEDSVKKKKSKENNWTGMWLLQKFRNTVRNGTEIN